jgi:2-dehydro-3-deoxygluconokinase
MAGVVTFGEAMLRLSPHGRLRIEQAAALDVWPAGSELNVAIGLARLGTPAAWVSLLPRNPLADRVIAHARASGVDTSRVVQVDGERLGLYFVEVAEPPRTTTAWYDRAASAFARLDPRALDWRSLLSGARAFHTTGITPVLSDSCAEAVADALEAARAAGLHTSYDVNLRRQLAPAERARELLERFAPSLDVVLCSADDARALYGEADGDGLRRHLAVGLLVLAELDDDGRTWTAFGDGAAESASAPLVRPVDPIGAGDAFAAGFLHRHLAGAPVAEALAWGRAAATLKLTVPGDAPLLDRAEVAACAAGVETRLLR